MGLLNCWNWKNCGRYPGGPKVKELGVCPAAVNSKADGFLDGRNAGRACIFVAGTLCGGSRQGSFIDKEKHCLECDYYQALRSEYGLSLTSDKYKEYCAKIDLHKKMTDKDQPWISKNVPPEVTAENAKRRYSG